MSVSTVTIAEDRAASLVAASVVSTGAVSAGAVSLGDARTDIRLGAARAATRRMLDYLELTKPRIAFMALIVVSVAALIAGWGQVDPVTLGHTLVGAFLVAASASALNQSIESRRDSLMSRTAERPLPAGRLSAAEVWAFGAVTGLLGAGYLALMVGWQPAMWGLAVWVLYVAVYTPLKTRSHWNTTVGAVAGALPVMIGWSAAGAPFDERAAALLMTLFLWQFPHFMAIAWIYRRQYEAAGMKMLTVVDPSGRRAGVQAVWAALALLPVSFVPTLYVSGASWCAAAALLLGVGQLICAFRFLFRRDMMSARWLLRASLIYLAALLLVYVVAPLA